MSTTRPPGSSGIASASAGRHQVAGGPIRVEPRAGREPVVGDAVLAGRTHAPQRAGDQNLSLRARGQRRSGRDARRGRRCRPRRPGAAGALRSVARRPRPPPPGPWTIAERLDRLRPRQLGQALERIEQAPRGARPSTLGDRRGTRDRRARPTAGAALPSDGRQQDQHRRPQPSDGLSRSANCLLDSLRSGDRRSARVDRCSLGRLEASSPCFLARIAMAPIAAPTRATSPETVIAWPSA